MKKTLVITKIAALGLLCQSGLRAETITLLESFENDVENVSHNLGEADQRITKFAQSDDNDFGQITDGEKALQVSFESMQGWRQDFNVLLSPEATAILDGVVEGFVDNPEIGRFFLLYDITWDTLDSGAGWANNPINIGGYGTGAQVEWGGGGQPVTMDYDLGAGLPEGFALNLQGDNGDQTFLRFIFNSNTDNSMDVYVDNIRLLDTKPEGASTAVTVLDSFEENLDALLPAGGRTEEPVLNDDEFFVTDGAKSAKFTLTGDGTWSQDYTIDLEQYDLLTEILALPQEERFRYSLAWDWIPEVGDASVDWFQESVNPEGPGNRVTTGWAGDGNLKTRVINLGLVEWDFPPILTIIHNSNWSGGDFTVFLDNIRIIDTGAGASVPEDFEITKVERRDDGMVTLSWTSVEGASYAVDSSANLQGWDELDDGVPSTGDVTSFTATADGAREIFYRVRQLAQ